VFLSLYSAKGVVERKNQYLLDVVLTLLLESFAPTCFFKAVKYECWQKAMDEKLQALQDNHTWEVLPCPSNAKVIGCKWVYLIKLHFNGTLDRYKAQLVALQEYGVGYEEAFALVTKINIVHTVISIATF
jgi:hypothetical protein